MPNISLPQTTLEGDAATGDSAQLRPSLYTNKDAFIERISPVATAAIYFGSFSLMPQDSSLSRQALFKLSFLNRHFLQPAGLRIVVQHQTAVLFGATTSPLLLLMADILARQIEGIEQVKDETDGGNAEAKALAPVIRLDTDLARETLQLLFATDQTLRSGVQVHLHDGKLTLEGEIRSSAQKSWAEQLAQAVVGEVTSKLQFASFTPPPTLKSAAPPLLDDESLQALVLFRLRLVRETEPLPIKVKANRGVVTLQGKVRTEALRQRVENLSRSTLGIRELRSSLSIAP